MMKRYASLLLLATATAWAVPAAAQQIPPGQSCGGLLCDMGVFGHKVPVNADGSPPTPVQIEVANKQAVAAEAMDPHTLPCHDFLCRTFGGKTEQEMAEAAQAAAAQAAPAVAPAAEPDKPAKHAHKAKRKHLAKAETASADAAPAK